VIGGLRLAHGDLCEKALAGVAAERALPSRRECPELALGREHLSTATFDPVATLLSKYLCQTKQAEDRTNRVFKSLISR